MDFFASQDRSRRQTRWLLVMFALALAAIVAAVDLVARGGHLSGGCTAAPGCSRRCSSR